MIEKKVNDPFGPMNLLFYLFLGVGVLVAAGSTSMREVSEQSFVDAKGAVTLALGLIGVMAFWLGMMKILEEAGVVAGVARFIAPFFRKLFPDVPRNDPAFGAMVLNISANFFGLGNAATPFGIRAMEFLQKLNPTKDTATHAMCLFLAINTSGVAVLPLGVIGIRAVSGATRPAEIWIPTLLATIGSTVVAIISCLVMRSLSAPGSEGDFADESLKNNDTELTIDTKDDEHSEITSKKVARPFLQISSVFLFLTFVYLTIVKFIRHPDPYSFMVGEFASYWLMPSLILMIICYGTYRGVRVYDVAVEGAKEGFNVAVRIIPFMVVVLVAIGVFRASGSLNYVSEILSPITMLVGLPPEAIPMALVRPLSGTGAFALMSEIIQQDPNSYPAFVVSVLMGSTETTFYVVTVYFGAIGVVKFRYAILCGVLADIAGILLSGLLSFWWYY